MSLFGMLYQPDVEMFWFWHPTMTNVGYDTTMRNAGDYANTIFKRAVTKSCLWSELQ